MSYLVNILRGAGGTQCPIRIDEVEDVIRSAGGWTLIADREVTVIFTEADREVVCLWYSDGELWAKNPSDRGIDAMIALAKKLDARVRGDEYETYLTAAETYTHPDDKDVLSFIATDRASAAKWREIRHVLFRSYQIFAVGLMGWIVYRWLKEWVFY